MCKIVQKNFLITDGLQMKKTIKMTQQSLPKRCPTVFVLQLVSGASYVEGVASFASAQRSWALNLLMKGTVECMKMHKHDWVVALQLSQITVVTASLDQTNLTGTHKKQCICLA